MYGGFFLKLNMHEKNIPGDEMETYVEKIGCAVSHFPYCLRNFPLIAYLTNLSLTPFFLCGFFFFHHICRVTGQMDCV